MMTQVSFMKSMIRRGWLGWVALVCLAGTVPGLAHHSTAMYDYRNTQVVSGTVKEFLWTNPHMFIKVLVPDSQGKAVEWSVECGTPNINARHGWKRSDIKTGDKLTMEINPLRDGTPGGTLKWVQLPDGRKLWGPAQDIVALPAPAGAAPPGAAPPPRPQ